MVNQGDIIKINFNPQKGHEQAGYRPAVIISNNFFNKISGFAIVCPITNTNKKFPLRIKLDDRTVTTGDILCDQVRSLDINARGFNFVEKLPKDILTKVLLVTISEIDVLK